MRLVDEIEGFWFGITMMRHVQRLFSQHEFEQAVGPTRMKASRALRRTRGFIGHSEGEAGLTSFHSQAR